MADDPREPLGRIVHETRLAHEAVRAAEEGRAKFILGSWEDRSDVQREADMRIGSAVAAMAVHDAGIDLTELRKKLLLVTAHLPAVLEALTARIADERWESQKARFRDAKAALDALGGGKEQT